MRISTVICTHNPRRDYLERTLDSLRCQTLPPEDWELIIIDNQSSIPIAGTTNLSWHPNGKIVIEPELGLTPARVRGLTEATGDIIVFADDDNLMNPDYLEQVLSIFEKNSRLGCIGAGVLSPEFESEPLVQIQPYLSYLALRSLTQDYWGNQITGLIPWGAGLAVRRAVADAYREKITANRLARGLGRKGDSLLSGEDDVFSYVAVSCGWGIGIFISLRIIHLIPSRRLAIEYLERMLEANGATRAFLAHVHGENLINPFRPTSLGRLIGLAKGNSLRNFLKSCYAYFTVMRASRFDRRMAQLQFDGWNASVKKLKNLE